MDWATVPARMRSALFQLEEEAEEGHLDVVLMPALEIHQNPHSTRIHKMAAGQSPPQDALGAGTMSRCEKGPFPVIIVVFFLKTQKTIRTLLVVAHGARCGGRQKQTARSMKLNWGRMAVLCASYATACGCCDTYQHPAEGRDCRWKNDCGERTELGRLVNNFVDSGWTSTDVIVNLHSPHTPQTDIGLEEPMPSLSERRV